MYKFFLVAIIMAFITVSSFAQEAPKETTQSFEFNKDHFLAGSNVVQNAEGVDDLFVIGDTVRSNKDITGSVHVAGRKVIIAGNVGGDAYISAMEVTIDGKVSGDITVGGYKIKTGEIDGDIRAIGDNLTLSGPVSGYALIAGDEVKFESVVKGDVNLAAQEVIFADDSRIEGTLTLYEEKEGEIVVPALVIPEERIERRDISEWSDTEDETDGKSWLNLVFGFLKRVLFITVMAGLIAGVRPQKLADLRRSILGRPLRNLLFGFLAVSAGIGAAILLMFTGLGFLLVLVSLLIALLGAFTGYVVGTYAIGVKTLQWAKRSEPNSFVVRVIAAAVGAFAISLVAMIPYLGWLIVLAVALVGAGSLFIRVFQPKNLATI